jgi:hypothetical protein
MTCCDEYCYGCNQGRDCPARKTPVAKVGQRIQDKEPLPPSTWRNRLKDAALAALLVISALITATFMPLL